MINTRKINFKDNKLLLAFIILIALIISTGIIGILEIQGLSRRVEDLGRRNLKLEKAVLDMRINNTVYSMGIRNYVFWKISHYLGALPMAINLNNIIQAGESFKEQLKIYRDFAYLPEQKEWAKQADNSFGELSALGKQIISLSDSADASNSQPQINNLLMSFENKLYKIDAFLDNTMSRQNLDEVERQMQKAGLDERKSVFLLALALLSAALIGILIAKNVYKRLSAERVNREELFNQMINVEETQRKSLSTAVHDQMGQDLSALKIYLGLVVSSSSLRGAAGDEAISLRDNLEQCKKITAGLIEKSHNIAFMLRPPDLDEVGLTESLEAMVMDYKHLSGANFVFEKPKGELKLSSEQGLVIYRIAQELLTNMLKHAEAKNVKVRLNKKDGAVDFYYQDDGLGFDYEALSKMPHRRREDQLRLGLVSLKERVKLLDGSMLIDSAPGMGTRISVELPIS